MKFRYVTCWVKLWLQSITASHLESGTTLRFIQPAINFRRTLKHKRFCRLSSHLIPLWYQPRLFMAIFGPDMETPRWASLTPKRWAQENSAGCYHHGKPAKPCFLWQWSIHSDVISPLNACYQSVSAHTCQWYAVISFGIFLYQSIILSFILYTFTTVSFMAHSDLPMNLRCMSLEYQPKDMHDTTPSSSLLGCYPWGRKTDWRYRRPLVVAKRSAWKISIRAIN